jgi:hypothetical protein
MSADAVEALDPVIPAQDELLMKMKKYFDRYWMLLALFPVGLELAFSLHHLHHGWDDGAITASFARTWAHSGRIALTPSSPMVEGYSSNLWFLLLSVPYFFTHWSDAGIIWMRVLATVFALLSMRLIYLIARAQFADTTATAACVLIFAFCSTTLFEIRTGMEMNLATLLLLLLFHLLTNQRIYPAIAVGSLLLLARFEAPYVLLLLGCGFVLACRAKREGPGSRDLLVIGASLIGMFLFFELWRFRLFAAWMPNTVYAKRFAPYSHPFGPEFFITRMNAAWEPAAVLGVPLALAISLFLFLAVQGKVRFEYLKRLHPAIWMLAIGSFVFGALLGENWGYRGRMVGPMIPFLILVAVFLCTALPDRRQRHGAFAVLLAVQICVWSVSVLGVEPVWPTINLIEPEGLGADSIRKALNKEHLVALITDVGASSLCCDRLTILDSGLLANPTLAHTGWDGFAAYFTQTRPEVVETHGMFAKNSHIYDGPLLNDYSIVAAEGVRFFVRNDLYQQLVREHPDAVAPVSSVPACLSIDESDQQIGIKRGVCLVVSGADLQRNMP